MFDERFRQQKEDIRTILSISKRNVEGDNWKNSKAIRQVIVGNQLVSPLKYTNGEVFLVGKTKSLISVHYKRPIALIDNKTNKILRKGYAVAAWYDDKSNVGEVAYRLR